MTCASVKMASEARQIKGILKNSSSFDKGGSSPPRKEMKWDEMNILATYHPENKEYGHKKIDEPPTPYNKMTDEELNGSEDEGEKKKFDPTELAARLKDEEEPKFLQKPLEEESSEEDEEDTPEERAKRKLFEQKRKLHYNEFEAIKLARQLMEKDEELEEDEDAEEEENK